MKNRSKDNRVYFEHLDVVRFLAAFMILIYHAYLAWRGWFGELGILSNGTYKDLNYTGKIVNTFIDNFGIGVDVFFLISGFLITYILLEERKKFKKIEIGKFIIRRTLRIWPLYFALIIISPFLVGWLDSSPEPNYIANSLFLGNFDIIQTESWTFPFSHFWSICIEEHFYLIWPFIIAFIPRKKMLVSFISIIIVSILFRMYAYSYLEGNWYYIYLHTLSRMDVLVIGAFGALYYQNHSFEFKLNRWIRYLLYFILIYFMSNYKGAEWISVYSAGFKKYFEIGIIAVLLLDFNFNSKYKHYLPQKSWIHYLGKVSYGIYMFSNILILIIIKKIMWKYDIHNFWIFMCLNIGLSIGVSILSYELFEKQILKFNKYFRVIKTDR